MSNSTHAQGISTTLSSKIRRHDIGVIRRILPELASESVDDRGNTALHLACQPHRLEPHSVEVLKLLLENGSCIHSRNGYGWSALMLGALLLSPDCLTVLLVHRKAPGLSDSMTEALLIAADYGRPDCVKLLREAGVQIDNVARIDPEERHSAFLLRHRLLLRDIESLLGRFPEFDREIARNEELDETEADRLAQSPDEGTRKRVASNPSTSSKLLFKLGTEFPREFFKNPSFDWLLLEQPEFLFQLHNGVLRGILDVVDCPDSFIEWAARNGTDTEKLAVARREHVSAEILNLVASNSNGRVAAIAIARNESSKPEDLLGVCGVDDAADRLIAEHRNASVDVFNKLVLSRDDLVRKRLRDNPRVSPEFIEKLDDPRVIVHRLK